MRRLLCILFCFTLISNAHSQNILPIKNYQNTNVIDLTKASLIQMFEMPFNTLDKELSSLKKIKIPYDKGMQYELFIGSHTYTIQKTNEMLNLYYYLERNEMISNLKKELFQYYVKNEKYSPGESGYIIKENGFFYYIGIEEEYDAYDEYTCKIGIMKFKN